MNKLLKECGIVRTVILGSGTAKPSLNRSGPAQYLEVAEKRVLVNTGPGTLRQLRKMNIDYTKIDIVCITRMEPNRVAELGVLLELYNNQRTDGVLSVIGPDGLVEYLRGVIGITLRNHRLRLMYRGVSSSTERVKVRDFAISVLVSENGMAYRFDSARGGIVIADMDTYHIDSSLFGAHMDLMVLYASPAMKPVDYARIAEAARVKRLVMVHIDKVTFPRPYEMTAALEVFPQLIVGEDHMMLTV